jgi:hypothetical protein
VPYIGCRLVRIASSSCTDILPIIVLSHHTSLHPRPYRHITIPINIRIHMDIAISLHPILCSQPQSWSHSHSQSTTRNPLSVFNRIGPHAKTSSDLDVLPLSSTSFFGPRYTAFPSTLDLALIFATPYHHPRDAIPRYSVFGPSLRSDSQFWENYVSQSCQGLALPFLVNWLAGESKIQHPVLHPPRHLSCGLHCLCLSISY